MTAPQGALPLPGDHTPLREDRLDYTPTARSVSLARRRAARLVGDWGYPERAGDIALLVAELGANALLHGGLRGRLFRVHVMLTAHTLRVEVTDPRGERLPGMRAAGAEECYGRGLVVVDAIADRWGVEPLTVGKTVFAELSLHSRHTAGLSVSR